MKYTIDKGSTESAYMQLYRMIRSDIVQGTITYGTRMPSKRIMAEETGVSVITVEHAYNILIDEGYMEARQRSGYFTIYREKDGFSVAALAPVVKKMSVISRHSEEDLPFSVYARTLRRVLTVYGEQTMERSPNEGCQEIRQAISAYLARSRGIYVKPDQVILGAGSEYMYSILIQMLGRNRIYGLESPSFEKTTKVYRANGVRIDYLKLGPEGVLTEELERTPASVLHVTPYNSFPSGITASASKRQEYIHWAIERHAVIIEDDYDSEFSSLQKTEDTLFSLEPEGSVIYINSFTKTISPSIRAGYVILPEKLIPLYTLNTGFYSCTVPLLQQIVLAELLNSGDFERHINRVRRRRRHSCEK